MGFLGLAVEVWAVEAEDGIPRIFLLRKNGTRRAKLGRQGAQDRQHLRALRGR